MTNFEGDWQSVPLDISSINGLDAVVDQQGLLHVAYQVFGTLRYARFPLGWSGAD